MKTTIKSIGRKTAPGTARLVGGVANIKSKTAFTKRVLRSISLVFTLAALIIGQVPVAYADALNTISGNLTDNLGNPVKFAMVCMKESQSSTILGVQADMNGHYSLEVPSGMYSVFIMVNAEKDIQCDGMWIALKGSADCFDKSIYTIESYDKDLKDIFNSAIKHLNKFPVLNSIDYYDHTFVQQVTSLKNELIELSDIEPGIKKQISGLLAFIDKCMERENVGHWAFLFNGM